MTVKQDVRIGKARRLERLEAEQAKNNAEALCLAYDKNKKINEWRRKAMEYMASSTWKWLNTESKKYQKLRRRAIAAHEKWIEARGIVEELEASKEYANAIYAMLEWSGISESLLQSAPTYMGAKRQTKPGKAFRHWASY